MDFHQDDTFEFQPPEVIQQRQEELLRQQLRYCATQSPYYRELFAREKVNPDAVTLGSLAELPLTSKSDLSEAHERFLAAPPAAVVDIVLTSGTTVQPTPVAYTENDLQRLAFNEWLSFSGCGIRKDDTALLCCTIDRCFVAGLAYYEGLRKVGAAVLRTGNMVLPLQREVIARLRPTVIVGVPSFLRRLGQLLQESGMDSPNLGVRRMVCIGEPLRDQRMEPLQVARDLEALWGARLYSTYASTETVSTFCECEAQQGGHLHPNLAVLEVISRDGSPLGPGETGEVVVTPLSVEGMPLVRFKTGDISFFMDEPCSCGRNSPRLGPILGRAQQRLKVKGTTFYPQAVYSILDSIPSVREYYIKVESEDNLSDKLTVYAAVEDAAAGIGEITDCLQGRLRVRVPVAVQTLEEIQQVVITPKSRKPVRFLDLRSHSE